MKKYIVLVVANILILASFFVWFKAQMPKIAVVNLQKIVSKADKVQELRVSYNQKQDELEKWLDNSQQEIRKEKNKEKKESLINQYQDIARQKENLIKGEYEKNLREIQQEISDAIDKTAAKNNCNLVLYKTSVSLGGLDITNEVLQNL